MANNLSSGKNLLPFGDGRDEEQHSMSSGAAAVVDKTTGLMSAHNNGSGNNFSHNNNQPPPNQPPTTFTSNNNDSPTTSASTTTNSLPNKIIERFLSQTKILDKSTVIGAFLFALFQLVFFFAEASAITRPSRADAGTNNALLSPMALMACMGSLVTAPVLVAALGGGEDYPAL